MKILVVDDDPTFLFIFRKQIEKQDGLTISGEAENGQEALDFLQEAITQNSHLPDLIALDINMPVMDGWQFLDQYALLAREENLKIPVCILSSTINQADFDKAKTYGMVVDFYSKPITGDQLQKMRHLNQEI